VRSKTQYGVTMPDGAACGEGEGEAPLAPPPTVPIYQPCKYITFEPDTIGVPADQWQTFLHRAGAAVTVKAG
jgi:hypothetical protein